MQNMEILYICNLWLITANLEREKGWFHSHFRWAKCIAWYQLNINTFVEWRREYVGVVIDIFLKNIFESPKMLVKIGSAMENPIILYRPMLKLSEKTFFRQFFFLRQCHFWLFPKRELKKKIFSIFPAT